MSPADEARTLGELGRTMDKLAVQLEKTATAIEGLRRDIENRFVTRELHRADLRRVDERQDAYQKQTDLLLQGVEDEQRALHTDIDELRKQRDSDRRLVLTGLVMPLAVAVISGLILYAVLGK